MIRNILFSIFFFTGIIFISIIFLPSFFLPRKIVLIGGKLMGYWTGICLRFILSVKILIKGEENLIKEYKRFPLMLVLLARIRMVVKVLVVVLIAITTLLILIIANL